MPEAPRITPEDLHDKRERGEDIIVLDVRRGSWDRHAEKIKDAIRIDPDDYRDEAETIVPGATVATYCTCPSENTSARVASYLNDNGYRATALRGGYEAWVEAGFETEPKEGPDAASEDGGPPVAASGR